MTTEPAASPMIVVDGVVKRFGALTALAGMTFEVGRGEVVCLIGPSGSGKSTMLRCINFLESYDEGLITVGGETIGYLGDGAGRRVRPATDLARQRQRVGMVFQSYNLFPHLTALENVLEGPVHVLRRPRAEAQAEALALLDKVGLSAKANERPARLSGGQQQRVAIARALAMKPQVMLFDEVTSALDPELVGEVLQTIRALAEEGMTMVLVTHEIAFAREVAHRIIFMDEGQIVESGPARDLVLNPRTPRLQAFLRRFREGYML